MRGGPRRARSIGRSVTRTRRLLRNGLPAYTLAQWMSASHSIISTTFSALLVFACSSEKFTTGQPTDGAGDQRVSTGGVGAGGTRATGGDNGGGSASGGQQAGAGDAGSNGQSGAQPNGGEAGSGGMGGEWTPRELAGVSLWLRADLGVEPATSTSELIWSDQSKYAHQASSLVARSPSLEQDALGYAALGFSGKQCLQVPTHASLQFGEGGFTIQVVGSYSNAIEAGAFIWKGSAQQDAYTGPSLLGNYFVNADDYVSGAIIAGVSYAAIPRDPRRFVMASDKKYNDGNVRLYGMRRIAGASAKLEVRVDGQTKAIDTVPTLNIDAADTDVTIGGWCTPASTGLLLEGRIYEVVVVKGALTDTELSKLDQYLLKKYAIN